LATLGNSSGAKRFGADSGHASCVPRTRA
jgi:hypothetical protein